MNTHRKQNQDIFIYQANYKRSFKSSGVSQALYILR